MGWWENMFGVRICKLGEIVCSLRERRQKSFFIKLESGQKSCCSLSEKMDEKLFSLSALSKAVCSLS